MKKRNTYFSSLLLRYLILIILAFPNLYIFYLIFTPLTVYPVYFLLNLFYDASLQGINIFIGGCAPIELVGACIAGAAYYLLLILNLATPKIKINTRLRMILWSFLTLLVINILRIFLLSLLHLSGSPLFDATHAFFWYFMSIVFVVAIWFSQVKIFKIKEIPVYSDLKFLYKSSKLKK